MFRLFQLHVFVLVHFLIKLNDDKRVCSLFILSSLNINLYSKLIICIFMLFCVHNFM